MKKTAAALACALLILPAAVPAETVDAKGRSLLNALGCKACHRYDGRGAEIGPGLDKVGKRLSEKQIRRQIVEPRQVDPEGSMPSYNHLDEGTISDLVDFLSRQK